MPADVGAITAITLALNYLDGAGAEAISLEKRASVLIEHLSRHGYLVRRRRGAEWYRSEPTVFQRRDTDPASIQRMREAQGLTVTELAAKSGVSVQTIRALESGRRTPQTNTLDAILAALKHSPG